jgi:hypothetical protein
MDVTSIRAHKVEGGYKYRVVDEYEDERETEFDLQPSSSDKTLSMGQVIDIIESCYLISEPRELNLDGGCSPDEVYDFATVTSADYPDLETYFSDTNHAWIDEIHRVEKEEEEEERESKLEVERQEKAIAPYRNRIDEYVLHFDDQTIPNPKWRGHLNLQDVAKRCVEEYVSKNGNLPDGEHALTSKGFSGATHNFSDL